MIKCPCSKCNHIPAEDCITCDCCHDIEGEYYIMHVEKGLEYA